MVPRDTTTATLLMYFVDVMPLAEDKLTWIHTVIIKKSGPHVLKDYYYSYYIIAKYTENKFGTYKHFITNGYNENENRNTKYQNIQETLLVITTD